METSNSSSFLNEEHVPSSMTKKQAFEAMQSGKKVFHDYFLDDEYLYLFEDKIYTEEGIFVCNASGFFLYQKGVKFQTGWHIFS